MLCFRVSSFFLIQVVISKILNINNILRFLCPVTGTCIFVKEVEHYRIINETCY